MTNPAPERNPIWNRNDWLLLAFNAALFLILFAIFNRRLPETIGSHYNLAGEQDGTMPRWGFWLMDAALTVALPVLFKAFRLADPRKANYEAFNGYFELIRWALSLFLHGVMLMVIFTNLDYHFPMINVLTGGIGVLMAVMGNRLGQVRSNFFIGIRTPWTLMDDDNWKKTHRFGARLWVAAGIVMFVACWFVNAPWAAAVLLTCTIVGAIVPVVYSYLQFTRMSRGA